MDIGAFLLQRQKAHRVGRKCHNLRRRLDFAAGAKLGDQLLLHAAVGDADALSGQIFDVLDVHGLTVEHLDACCVVDHGKIHHLQAVYGDAGRPQNPVEGAIHNQWNARFRGYFTEFNLDLGAHLPLQQGMQ